MKRLFGLSIMALASVALMAACGGPGVEFPGFPGFGADDDGTPPSPVSNPFPYVDGGPDQTVSVGSLITLNGSGSGYYYAWTMTSKPAGSNAFLWNASTLTPSFIADAAGTYTIVFVTGGWGTAGGGSDTVVITAIAGSSAVTANAGSDQCVLTGMLVGLDGSGSADSSGGILTYAWTMVEKPAASTAILSSHESSDPTFTADVPGTYVVVLVVSNGAGDSSADSVTITATAGPETGSWQPVSLVGGPSGRFGQATVWTGSEMIVWGGWRGYYDGSYTSYWYLDTGGRYDPLTDAWRLTSLAGAPSGRRGHTAVWTGSEMIVWGGDDGASYMSTGGKYDPATDTWQPLSLVGAPSGRSGHTAVWTGSTMIVWGGYDDTGYLSTGGRYDPLTDAWQPLFLVGAPSSRSGHTAVWTGSVMIVWGGYDDTGYLSTGGRYDPQTDTWREVSLAGVPSGRGDQTAVWTGSEMIVWGGYDAANKKYINTGGKYDPVTDTWRQVSPVGAPLGRRYHSAVWTGSEMIIWGGERDSVPSYLLDSGGLYNPVTDAWRATSTEAAPERRKGHAATWTGLQMIVWGGMDRYFYSSEGGRYTP